MNLLYIYVKVNSMDKLERIFIFDSSKELSFKELAYIDDFKFCLDNIDLKKTIFKEKQMVNSSVIEVEIIGTGINMNILIKLLTEITNYKDFKSFNINKNFNIDMDTYNRYKEFEPDINLLRYCESKVYPLTGVYGSFEIGFLKCLTETIKLDTVELKILNIPAKFFMEK